MGILDDALNSQDIKRSQRLSKEAQKSKIENNKIKEGTYRGIDLVDGTAKIQLDGQTNTTSGYKLITNAPLGDGDRVSIRPNGVGMPRADAKNVAPDKAIKEQVFADIAAKLRYLSFWVYSTYGYSSLPSVFAQIGIGSDIPIIDYIYDGRTIRYKQKTKLKDLPPTVFRVTEDTTNPAYVVGMNRSLCSFQVKLNPIDAEDKNELTINLNQALPTYPNPWINPVNSSGLLASPVYGAYIEFEIFFPEKEFKSKFKNIQTDNYTEANSPFEFEIIINGAQITTNPLDTPIIVLYYDGSGFSGKGWYLSFSYSYSISPNLTQYIMSFRYRKRVASGDPLPWFSLS